MKEKPTTELKNELMSEASIDSYIRENSSYFSNYSVAELLTELYKKKSLSKAALARKAGIHTDLNEINDKLFSENEKTLL